MANLFDAGRIQIEVSKRELKFKDGETVTVYKNIEGVKTPTATLIFSDINTMKSYLTTEQIETLACANHLVRCQNIARNWDKEKANPLDRLIKAKGLNELQASKLQAYLEKMLTQ